ncbi:MAG TPA: hypothetical protein PKC30_14335 [Saprospiraceae bacterium]|nr:hypothetical protein [Saprospiraceae bacterium]
MKKNQNNFSLGMIIISLASLSFIPVHDSVSNLKNEFLIQIQKTDNGVEMNCEKGCWWKRLTFSLSVNNQVFVNQSGTVRKIDTVNDESNPMHAFLLSVHKTKTGLQLLGIQGTSWKKLSFDCRPGICRQLINQDGMVKN